jgi:serine/threonine-protein kinase
MNTNENIALFQKARQIMEQLVDKPLPEALAALDDLCQGDQKLVSTVTQLLKAASLHDTVFDRPENIIFDCALNEGLDLSGQTLGNYRLLELIGEGGLSQVYRARRRDQRIQKDVAVKMLFPGRLSQRVLDLFNQEQVTLSQLDHPAIISLHHGGTTAEGVPYLVLDYIKDARTLTEHIKAKRLSTREIVILILSILNGLEYAHQHFIVHGDLKPNNILVDQNGHAQLVDFGLARLGEQTAREGKPLLALTPGYAAPEQVQGRPITTHSDVFSLCAVLLELLSGHAPLPNQDISDYDPQMVEVHIQRLLQAVPLDNDLKAILNKGLSLVPEQRYASAAEAASDLRAWLDGRPVTARSHSRLYRWGKALSTHKLAIGSSLAIATAIGIGVWMAVQAKEKAQQEARKAQEVKNFLIEAIGKSDPEYQLGATITLDELLSEAAIALQHEKIRDPTTKGEMLLTIGTAQAKAGQPEKARQTLKQSIDWLTNPLPAELMLAEVNLENKYFDNARHWLQKASHELPGATILQRADFFRLNGLLLQNEGRFQAAEKALQKAATFLQRHKSWMKPWVHSRRALAGLYRETGQVKKGKTLLQDTLRQLENWREDNKPAYINTLYDLAMLLQSSTQQDLLDSEKILSQVVEMQRLWYGDKHPKLAKSLTQLATTQRVLGKLQKAQQSATEAFDIASTTLGKNHVAVGRAEMVLAAIALQTGNMDSALEQMAHAISTFEIHFGMDHFETNQHKTTYAALLLRQGQPAAALKILKPLALLQFSQLGPRHQASLYVQLNLVKAYTLLGELDKAVDLGEASLAISKDSLGADHLVTIGLQKALADAWFTHGDLARALPLYRKLLQFPFVQSNPAWRKSIEDKLHRIQSHQPRRKAS